MCIQIAIDNVKKYATNIAFSVKMSGVAIVYLHDYALVSRAIHTQLRLAIALFTVSFSHLHYNEIQRVCEAISG